MLENGPKISDPTKSHDTQLNFFHINGKLAQKSCRADFSNFSGHLKHSLPKGVRKQDLWGIQETTFFGLNNFQNVWAIKVIFFKKTLKIVCIFQKCKKVCKKYFWFPR